MRRVSTRETDRAHASTLTSPFAPPSASTTPGTRLTIEEYKGKLAQLKAAWLESRALVVLRVVWHVACIQFVKLMLQSTPFYLLVKCITIVRDHDIRFFIQDDHHLKRLIGCEGQSVSSAARPGVLADQFEICSWYRFWSSLVMCISRTATRCKLVHASVWSGML